MQIGWLRKMIFGHILATKQLFQQNSYQIQRLFFLSFFDDISRNLQFHYMIILISMKNQSTQHLDDSRKQAQDQPTNGEQNAASFFALFRFANKLDYLLMVFGTFCSIVMGGSLPLFSLLWGNMTDSFGNSDQMVESARQILFQYIYLGIASTVAGWGMFSCWMIAGERQAKRCRTEYLRSIMKQQIEWFDLQNQAEISSKFSLDVAAYQLAIGEKISTLTMTVSMFFAGFGIALAHGWILTLVILASMPVIVISWYLFIVTSTNQNAKEEQVYLEADSRVTEGLSLLKTVKQLNGEEHQSKAYAQALSKVSKKTLKQILTYSTSNGFSLASILLCFALTFWFGSECVKGSEICPSNLNKGNTLTAGDVLLIFYSLVFPAINLSQLTPSFQKIVQGKKAAARIFSIIDRVPAIKSPSNPIIPSEFKGVFRFNKVCFAYPKDKSKKVLSDFNMEIRCKSSALVGDSGCGKSTVFQLLLRFYDPDSGVITLDGTDIKLLSLEWLRSQIGYVGQEPTLFAGTVRENLLLGKAEATEEEIMAALKKAEAHNFISELREGVNTYVGSGGSQLSGGQKQRIAIARALLKSPKLLLLDEATSALDRRNERLIQATLSRISHENMTVTIAHRLKTVVDCEQVFVIANGAVSEHGPFTSLQRFQSTEIRDSLTDLDSPLKLHDFKQKKMSLQQTSLEDIVLKSRLSLNDNIHKRSTIDKKGASYTEDANPNNLSTSVNFLAPKQTSQQQNEQENTAEGSILRLFGFVKSGFWFILVGIFVAIADGVVFPFTGIYIAKILAAQLLYYQDPEMYSSLIKDYCLTILIAAVIAFIVNTLQYIIFVSLGMRMATKIRCQAYNKMLKLPVSWFEKEENHPQKLSGRLASDCKVVKGLVSTYIPHLTVSFSNIAFGIILAFIFEWRTALVALGMIPLICISGGVQTAFIAGFASTKDQMYKDAGQIVVESLMNIRTILSLGSEKQVVERYGIKLNDIEVTLIKKSNISGFFFGLSYLCLFMAFAVIFFLAAIFIRDNSLDISDSFASIFLVIFASVAAGNNANLIPDLANVRSSAQSLFNILDAEDEDDLQRKAGSLMLTTPIRGDVVFKNVSFKYKNRGENALTNVSFCVEAGQKVGLVGHSGCGKSTTLQLLLGFYPPSTGEIMLDGVSLKDFDVHHLRASLGFVNQQPALFNASVAYNIRYNQPTSDSEVLAAAKEANFSPENEEFKNPERQSAERQGGSGCVMEGLQKNVGPMGSHISGGQKQRVAIARALLRRPTVLLLDEATSALDPDNERRVQAALSRSMQGRTSLSVTHKLENVKSADQILVFEKGQIINPLIFLQLTTEIIASQVFSIKFS